MQLDFVDDDIRDHTPLDAKVYTDCESDCNKEPPLAVIILSMVVVSAPDKLDQKFKDFDTAKDIVVKYSQDPDEDENSNLRKLLVWCWLQGTFERIRRLKILRPMPVRSDQTDWQNSERLYILRKLDVAYNKPFVGNAATDLIKHLRVDDHDIRCDKLEVYAKAISVLQSSGMGKLRMLTEVGRHIFTLPICLRHPRSPGYPPSDTDVYYYFMDINTDNDMNLTAHSAIARFLTAAHETMLKWLKDAQQQHNLDATRLHTWWYEMMEQRAGQIMRQNFFSEVLRKAKTIKLGPELPGTSPTRPKDPNDPGVYDIVQESLVYYENARVAVEALMAFLGSLDTGEQPLCVTYFDEAHELQTRFWILLRLLSHQPSAMSMWYVFMGTKSRISYFTPPPRDMFVSLRLLKELRKLLPPYIALDFDHNVLKSQAEVTATIGELQSIEHLASYGRPVWKAHLPEERDGMVKLASGKLLSGSAFDDQKADHVFAVLSQRLCIEPVLVSSEAIALADRSVASHMRLITGISDDRRTFYTYSPSEPILVLGAVNILYNPGDDRRLGRVLDTFSKHLCSAGLVEKGLTGELGARILLLLARDLTAPVEHERGPNLLKPVLLLKVIDTLFGDTTWAGIDKHRKEYDEAFSTAHVNFTHWIVTKDPLLELPDQVLLANLWARGAILQCCFNQASIDFLMVVYHGDISTDASFDPAMLSAVFGQVKFKSKADTTAEQAIRPIGLPRDLSGPLPYLALLFELGNESFHGRGANSSRIKVTIPEPTTKVDEFKILRNDWLAAVEALEDYQKGQVKKERTDPKLVEKQKKVKEARLAMDAYNRYTIAVRGASADVYGILRMAKIETEFATLLTSTMPSPTAQDETIQHMRPLERLGSESGHTAWMSRYVVGEST
ncbi:hypothetical protein PILCRDRAFT_4708 [Piloderma croceum F 1598]|uniref:Uncharacterized protein n=1 Tax=Piloderma croceum (strain F 1598) TaxID=765440 RepID=A0A0C3FS36_PILCF|nr:hypothetical protein PILCRDRAFT_4708 [Piloderma croceum F 1598]